MFLASLPTVVSLCACTGARAAVLAPSAGAAMDDGGAARPAKPPAKGEEPPGDKSKPPAKGEEPPGNKGKPPAKGEEPPGDKGSEPKGDPPPADEPRPPAGEPPPPSAPAPAPPPTVTLSELKFVGGGEVPDAAKHLDETVPEVAKCVADHGGLAKPEGELKMQLLVRVRGRAEGVEVLGAKGVMAEAGRCVRKLLKHRRVGVPTADPVGILFRYRLRRAP